METTLAANARDVARGKSGTRKARAKGLLPAVVYGPGSQPISIEVEPRALTEMFRKSNDRNTIVQLSLEGRNVPCLVREVQRHPLSREILHVDFYAVTNELPLRTSVPLVVVGKSKGLSLGGRVQLLRRTVDVLCKFDCIPKSIEIDVSETDIGDTIRVSSVKAPAGVEIQFDQDFPVVSVAGKLKEREETPAAGAEGAAATPAAATPAKKG